MQVLIAFFLFFFCFSSDSSCRVVFLVILFLIVFLFFAKINFLCSTRVINISIFVDFANFYLYGCMGIKSDCRRVCRYFYPITWGCFCCNQLDDGDEAWAYYWVTIREQLGICNEQGMPTCPWTCWTASW